MRDYWRKSNNSVVRLQRKGRGLTRFAMPYKNTIEWGFFTVLRPGASSTKDILLVDQNCIHIHDFSTCTSNRFDLSKWLPFTALQSCSCTQK